MRVLVTGNNGLIGRVLVQYLSLKNNTDVVLFRTAGHLRDICDHETVRTMVKGVDVIFHLAALLNYHPSNPREMEKINVDGTRIVFETAFGCGVKEFIFASSQEVYSASKGCSGPLAEDVPLLTRDAYGQSKLNAEMLCARYMDNTQTNVVILRIASVYGHQGLNRNNALVRYIKDAKTKKVIQVFGEGKRIHDYVYVDDVAQAMVHIIGHRGVYNLGGGRPYTSREMAETVQALLGGQIVYDRLHKENPGFYMDISKIKSIIDYTPRNLQTGLELTISSLTGDLL